MRQNKLKKKGRQLLKRIAKTLIIFVTIILILFVLFRIIKVQNIILKQIYPLKYTEYVEEYAEKYNLDKYLVYAIIKAESNFEPNIVSSSGAIGLMQLMDATAEELAEEINYDYPSKEILYRPETSIALGTAYFDKLLSIYEGNIPLALTAYNAGIGNVGKWIEAGTIQSDGNDIENIPFKETNNYVRKILRDYKIYQELYEK